MPRGQFKCRTCGKLGHFAKTCGKSPKETVEEEKTPPGIDRGKVDNGMLGGILPDRERKLPALEGGKRKPIDQRVIELSGDHAKSLDDVLLYRMPVCARIADRLKRLVLRDHPQDFMLLNLVELLNESVELGAVRSRTLYCVLTKEALRPHWEGQGPARGIRP